VINLVMLFSIVYAEITALAVQTFPWGEHKQVLALAAGIRFAQRSQA
jgi:hypothetical protein